MGKHKSIYIIVLTFLCGQLLFSQPLIAPDTVYISPAYYNLNSKDVGVYTLFDIKVNNPTGLEIISMASEVNFNIKDPNDLTIINTLPQFYVNKTGNIILEDGSSIVVKANIFYNNPASFRYETDMFINYKTKEQGFQIDTVHIIAERTDTKIYTINQKLTRDICEGNSNPELFKVYSSLVNGTNKYLKLDSINLKSNLNYRIVGYLNKLFDNFNEPLESIKFPYSFNETYLTIEMEFLDSIMQNDYIYIDYFTENGLFTDTIAISYSKMKGITAKSWYQILNSFEYNKVESNSLALRLCSEQGYKIKAIRLEGEVDESEIEFQSFFEIGEIINKPLVELAKFEITPQKIPFDRSGTYVYELENMASGNIISVDFPFTLKIDLTTDISDSEYNESLIYPNPAKNIINFPSDLNITNAEIINPVGEVIYSEDNSNSIDVSGISKGFYFIRLTSYKNTFIEKIIIE